MTRYTPHSELNRAELEAEYGKPQFERPQLPRLALDHCKDFLGLSFYLLVVFPKMFRKPF